MTVEEWTEQKWHQWACQSEWGTKSQTYKWTVGK